MKLAKISVFISFLFFVFSCKQTTQKENNKSNLPSKPAKDTNAFVIGFYQGNLTEIDKYDVSKLTHLIFCFTHLKGNKMCLDSNRDELVLQHLVSLKEKHPRLKVLISLGGWGGCETCSDVFSSKEGRIEFVQSVKEMLVKYSADGIDLDWESPVIGGYKNHKHAKVDKDNFTELVKELRSTLNKNHLICFDANCFDDYLKYSIDWKNGMPYVDWVNLMSYGLPGDSSGLSAHNSALYSSRFQYESADKGVRYLDSVGVPLKKIIIGAAFYAIAYENVDSTDHGQRRRGKMRNDVMFKNMETKYPVSDGFEDFRDTVAQVPYMYSYKLRTFVSYDDSLSVTLKMRYAIEHKLGGIMFWKLNGDKYTEGLLDAIYREKFMSYKL